MALSRHKLSARFLTPSYQVSDRATLRTAHGEGDAVEEGLHAAPLMAAGRRKDGLLSRCVTAARQVRTQLVVVNAPI